jgi:glutamate 5-kinase
MARLVVKLGSSVVADPAGELRAGVLAALCREVGVRRRAGDEVVLVSSGAIARGIRIMGLPVRPTAIEDLQAASAVGQGPLYQAWSEGLRAEGVPSAQVLLTFFDLMARTHYLNARQTLRRLLDWGLVPVINENDTTTTDEISFGDNDFLAAQLAILVGADRLVLLTDIDGLFSADPRRTRTRDRPEVSDPAQLEALAIGHGTSPLGRAECARRSSRPRWPPRPGSPRRSATAPAPDALPALLAGLPGEGTRFPAAARATRRSSSGSKYAKPSHGTVVVDRGARAGAARGRDVAPARRHHDVRGEFDAGDAVHVAEGGVGAGAATRRAIIGKGIVNYTARELRQVGGLKSAQIRELLPRATDEAVHRDYFVLG